MAYSLNKVTLIGALGRDPESKSFQNGGGVTELRVATSESWKDRNSGERRERTEWHTVKIFSEGLRGVADRYLRKGSRVYIEGQLQTRKWQDQQGNDRYSTEIVLQGYNAQLGMIGDPKNAGGGSGGGDGGGRDWGGEDSTGRSSGQSGRGGGGNFNGGGGRSDFGGGFGDDLDDDVPFITSDIRYEGRAG